MKKVLSLLLTITMLCTLMPINAHAGSFDDNLWKLENVSTKRWADPIGSNLYDNGDGTFTVLHCAENKIVATTYRSDNYAALGSKEIAFELELFGGFYAGEKYNYIVFGQTNEEQDNHKEVIRVVKYDKDFNRLNAGAISCCYTTVPFDAGTVRMAENGNELTIHTCRERYDGHQSNLTINIDTNTMMYQNFLSKFPDNHVSHSFNQFVRYDNSTQILLDHGDAYPRGIVLHKNVDIEEILAEDPFADPDYYYIDNKFSGRIETFMQYDSVNLFKIPGDTGANCTGVTVGGFEISKDNYLVAMNTIDHSKVSKYTSFEMVGLGNDERDIVLLVSDKENTQIEQVKQVYLTDYVGKNKLGSKPYLVKISDDRFVVLWVECDYVEDTYGYTETKFAGLKYAMIDGDGNVLSGIRSTDKKILSSGCQPVKIGNKLVWYVDDNGHRQFYDLKLSTLEQEGSPFYDVEEESYYYDAVLWAVKNKITSGTSETTFSPDASCTRAQMVTFLWRANGSPQAAGANPFTDVQPDAYYYDAVLWAVKNKITSGTSETTFSPDASCTRSQTVTFLYRNAGSPAVSGSSFSDVAPTAYYANAVAWAVKEGITVGTSETTFSPNTDCTRAQIVTFLYRDAR